MGKCFHRFGGRACSRCGARSAPTAPGIYGNRGNAVGRGNAGIAPNRRGRQCRGRGNAVGRGNVVVSVGALRAAASKPAFAAKNAWGNVVVPTFMPDSNIFIGSRHAFWAALAGPLVSLLFL